MSKTEVIIEPRFMGPEGARFFTTRFSCGGSRGNVVFIPPFAEEMNRCRSFGGYPGSQLCSIWL